MPQFAGIWDSGMSWLEAHPTIEWVIALAVLLAGAYVADVIAKRVLLVSVGRLVKRSRVTWDDALHHHRVFECTALLVPIYIVHSGLPLVPGLPSTLSRVLQRFTAALLALIVVRAIAALLKAVNAIYSEFPTARSRPIKGYLQVATVVVYVVGTVLVIAALLDKSPVIFLSGLGAMTAVLLLVFRDTILSLVASIQLTGNDMVQVGDWIEMPSVGADGDVIDIALHTIKVQNWDKTISTIPTYRLITESFKNWRGMSSSGGRRIKRSVFIDQGTVRSLSDEEVERFRRVALLEKYVEEKQAEIAAYNQALGPIAAEQVNLRRLTNIGTLRAYIVNYLRHHPKIHQDMTLMVRQLDPTPLGLPIQIYAFTNTTAWVEYEGIISDIFDHILAIVPEFGLRVFQQPAGADLAKLGVESRSSTS